MAFNLPDMQSIMEKAWGLKQPQIPSWQKWIFLPVMPVLKMFVENFVGTQDKKALEESTEAVEKQFGEMDNLVSFLRF